MKRLVALLALLPAVAAAHGGLPVTQKIMRPAAGEQMFVPVFWWGIWVGDGVGPWRWICEEVVNDYRSRKYALGKDGSFYATGQRGLSISTDQGCTFHSHAGILADRKLTWLATDPVDGAVLWTVTDDPISVDPDAGFDENGLFVSRDHGETFSRLTALTSTGLRFTSVLVAPSDGNVVYATSTSAGPRGNNMPALHRTSDGGASFEKISIDYLFDGIAPYAIEMLAIDPRDPTVVYVRAFVTVITTEAAAPWQVLLRSLDGGRSFTEVHRRLGEISLRGIDGVAIDPDAGKVWMATNGGLFVGDDAGRAPTLTLARAGNLSSAQCVEARGGAVFACSSNYAPDFAALARSDDGGKSFKSILSFQNTRGPVDHCPAGTPAADECPRVWLSYRDQLGITTTTGGTTGGGGGDCGCRVGGHQAAPIGAALLLVAIAMLRLRRRS